MCIVTAVRIKPVDAGQKDGFDEGRGAVAREGAGGKVTIEMTTELGTAGSAEDAPLPQSVAATAASSSTASGRTKTTAFAPEHVFMPDSTQAAVYESCAREVVLGVVAGVNGAVIAYGQTGSGKTHTMLGDPASEAQQGIIPRATTDIFARLEAVRAEELARPGVTHVATEVTASYVEIYNENPYDLLSGGSGGSSFGGPSAASAGATASSNFTATSGARGAFGSGFGGVGDERRLLRIREDVDTEAFFLEDLTRVTLVSPAQAMEVLQAGFELRRTASTAMNARSSRSHAVLTLMVEVRVTARDDESGASRATSRFGLLDIVDLAGSERQRDTGAEGATVKEAGKINNSLGSLAECVKTSVDNQLARHSRATKPVPWRNSRLTMLLKRSLSGNSRTTFVFCISPALEYWSESVSTLLFADRARRLRTEPSTNERTVLMGGTQVQLKEMAREIAALKLQLARAGGPSGAAPLPAAAAAATVEEGSSAAQLRIDFAGAATAPFASAPFPSSSAPTPPSPLIQRQLRGLDALGRALRDVDAHGAAAAAALDAVPDTSAAALAQIEARVRDIEADSVSSGLAHVAAQLAARLAALEAQVAAAAEMTRAGGEGPGGAGDAARRETLAGGVEADASAGLAGADDYGRLSSGGRSSLLGSPGPASTAEPTEAEASAASVVPGGAAPAGASRMLRAVEARLGQWRAAAAAELAAPMTEVLHEAARKDAALAEYRLALGGFAAKNSSVAASIAGLRGALAAVSALAGDGGEGAGACVLAAAAALIEELNGERRRLRDSNSAVTARLQAADEELVALRSQMALQRGGGGGGGGDSEVEARRPVAAARPVAQQGFSHGAAVTAAAAARGAARQPPAAAPAAADALAPLAAAGPAAALAVAAAAAPFDDEAEPAVAFVAADPERLTAETLVAGTARVSSARGGAASFLRPFALGASESLRHEKPRVSSAPPAEVVAALVRGRTMSVASAGSGAGGGGGGGGGQSPGGAENACGEPRDSLGEGSAEGSASAACRQAASARASMVSVAESTSSVGTSISGRMEAAERADAAAAQAAATAAAAAAKIALPAPAPAPQVKRPLASLISRAK